MHDDISPLVHMVILEIILQQEFWHISLAFAHSAALDSVTGLVSFDNHCNPSLGHCQGIYLEKDSVGAYTFCSLCHSPGVVALINRAIPVK